MPACPPPRITSKAGCGEKAVEVTCDPHMVAHAMELLTQPCMVVYYGLAGYFTFGFSTMHDASPPHLAMGYSVARCLPLLYLISYVIYSKAKKCGANCFFCKYILLGLVVSCVGEFLLQYDPHHFMHAVCLYTVAILLYTGGNYYKYKGSSLSKLILVWDVVFMAAMYMFVAGYLAAVVLFGYGAVTMAMVFFAVARYERERTAPAYLGASGCLLLQTSHALYALMEFSPTFQCEVNPQMVMVTFYLSQLAIGLSVHYC